MMLSLDELEAELEAESVHKGSVCSVSVYLNSVDPADREVWEQVMRNPRITAAAIARKFEKMDIEVSQQAVQRHVARVRGRMGCKCPR